MYKLFSEWYKRKFSDPHAVTLVVILVSITLFITLFSNLLMPVFVAIALAFLLDLPVNKLVNNSMSRTSATIVVVITFVGFALLAAFGLLPLIWKQSSNLLQEVPHMVSLSQDYLMTLPEKYPDLVDVEQIKSIIAMIKNNFLQWGQVGLKGSLNAISDIVALLIYLILVPLMVFFFLKDKADLINSITFFLPKERRMANKVSNEMNQQILNYIRGKVIEIIIVGTSSTVAFMFLDLQYSLLLGVLVGLSVLVPYVGATVVTLPVMLVALFQFGFSSEFGYVMLAYGIIQAIDGNVIVPLLFSEAVNLHPVTIIIAVIFFGGMWGFWGVFFAIPLATLVKAVINAWPTIPDAEQKLIPETVAVSDDNDK
ncbi:AI-2E family transporter [Colwellia sp. E2M01]|uniref:AI-2E family transporter n=1 Tax=Colwellia sp. E2M01 TaxID=2841561 RepID=UPI001C08DA72|nr:AI-2E family transporter [Colwellia sp. E2M01]MBU2871281.1 AI-2E family transporter [Colwellia sp. E2M01]